MLDERDYMFRRYDDPEHRYDERPDETRLAPLVIKYGAAPVPDLSTPEGRHDNNLNGVFLTIFIVLFVIGSIFFPIK